MTAFVAPAANFFSGAGVAFLWALGFIAIGFVASRLSMRWSGRRHPRLRSWVAEATGKLEREIRERTEAERQAKAFALLGQKLSFASTQTEAAETIVAIADELLGWDSCGLHAYSQEDDSKVLLLNYDEVDGRRVAVSLDTPPAVSDVMRRTVEEGPQLILREVAAFEGERTTPFGDRNRPSASLMYAPIRNGKRVVGVLSIQSYRFNAYTQDNLDVLQALADYCAGALERIRAAEALRESQNIVLHQERLAAIGRLSSGAAHEFNNILTVVQGHCDLLLSNGNVQPENVNSLREIAAGARRAANLTGQLLSFSRKQPMQTVVLDLNQVVADLTKILDPVLGEHIECECHYGTNLPPITADPAMIEQVLLNLVMNARDAMPSGGKVIITTGDEIVTAQHGHPEARPGHFATLRIADNGCGMDAATLAQVFEPFFTTKEVGKGTGLGLASVYGAVKQHAGWIEVSSRLGVGTEFQLNFPLASGPVIAAPPPGPGEHLPERSSGSETILVVEDEDALRQMICSYLTGKNYRVLEARDGVSGLEEWSRATDRIDLVFTDMVLPNGVSGKDIARRVRQDNPTVPVIITSGFSLDFFGPDLGADPLVTFLPKPYRLGPLADLIRDRIERGRKCQR